MTKAQFVFPNGFLWGTATSSYQVEGGHDNNNWAEWERTQGRIVDGARCGKACDWRGGRWKEDLLHAKEMGQNAHRLSIEWASVQPTPDQWDENSVEFYRNLLREMVSMGLKPMVTLHHFTDPLWLTEIGGWENPLAPSYFLKFAENIVHALKPFCTQWVTINEPNVYVVMGYLYGKFPPGKEMDWRASFRVYENMLIAHAAVYEMIHREQVGAEVGVAYNYRGFFARSHAPMDRLTAFVLDQLNNQAFCRVLEKGSFRLGPIALHVKKAKNTQDFIGLNYYTADQVKFSTNFEQIMQFLPGASLSDSGFLANEPTFFARALRWAGRFGKPVYVTENGVENEEDTFRREYLADHLLVLWRAWTYGVPVRGYYHWSLVDNFEWERGWTQRFGLWRIDPDTQVRTKRPSVDFYGEICQKNRIDLSDLETYAPIVMKRLFD